MIVKWGSSERTRDRKARVWKYQIIAIQHDAWKLKSERVWKMLNADLDSGQYCKFVKRSFEAFGQISEAFSAWAFITMP